MQQRNDNAQTDTLETTTTKKHNKETKCRWSRYKACINLKHVSQTNLNGWITKRNA